VSQEDEEPHSEPLTPPRGRLYQDDEFQVDDLVGETLERIVGYVTRESREPEMLLLKPRGRHWQRCFIDAGLGFWAEWSEDDAFSAYHDEPALQMVDFGTELMINGSPIIEVSCCTELDGRARITVRTTKGDIFLRALDPKDLESPVEIGFAARPEDA
jgi:hypothetical protein